jgi:hypothetical protein
MVLIFSTLLVLVNLYLQLILKELPTLLTLESISILKADLFIHDIESKTVRQVRILLSKQ